MTLIVILLVLLLLFGGVGVYGGGRGWGAYGYSPMGLIFLLIILAIAFGWHL